MGGDLPGQRGSQGRTGQGAGRAMCRCRERRDAVKGDPLMRELQAQLTRIEAKVDALTEALAEDGPATDAPVMQVTLDGDDVPVAYPDMGKLLDGSAIE